MDRYLDFDLVLERVAAPTAPPEATPGFGYPSAPGDRSIPSDAPRTYLARVTGSPAGRAERAFTLPFQPLEVENFALKLGHRRGMRRMESSSAAEARAFGQRLFNAVFAGEVALAYGRSIDEARRSGGGLRIRLRLEDQSLASIPWEFMHYEAKDDFLVLSKQTPLVRVLDVPRQLRSAGVELPLRILVMVSSPSDQDSLDVEAEYSRLETAMQDRITSGHVEMVRVNGSMSELQRALRQSKYHIFHFIGHGGFDQAHDDGVLVLESATGSSEFVPGSKLGTLLHDEPTLQLVMLNACEAGRASGEDPFSGVAQSLVRKGMPAVIAMQFEISDSAAIVLSHDFYGALSDGLPVDAALAEARKAIYAAGDGVEWGTPVLYLQNSSGQLFDVADTLPAPVVSTAPSLAPQEIRMAPEAAPVIKPAPEVPTAPVPTSQPPAPQAPAPQPSAPDPVAAADAARDADLAGLATPVETVIAPEPAPTSPPPSDAHITTAQERRLNPLMAVGAVALIAVLGAIGFAMTRSEPEGRVATALDVVAAATVEALAPVADEPTAQPEPTAIPEPTATPEPPVAPEPIVDPVLIASDDIRVARIDTPPVIDGLEDDWSTVPEYYVTEGLVYQSKWNGNRTAWSSFSVAHDDDNMYFVFTVSDDIHDQIFTGSSIYNGDAININIAGASSADSSGPAPGDTQLTMTRTNDGAEVLYWWTGDGEYFTNGLGDFGQVSFATRDFKGDTAVRYNLEASIPKGMLPDNPTRILVSLNDSDGEHAQTVVFGHLIEDAVITQANANPIFQSPNQWGRLIFE